MMPSRTFLRLLTYRASLLAGLAAFMSAGLVDAAGAHGCPHHDRTSSPAAQAGGHMAPGAAQEGTHHGGGPCTCVGGACTTAPVGLPQDRQADVRLAVDVVHGYAAVAYRTRTPVRVPYLQPFANAPPIA
jgi:hypothetical protein